MLLIAPFTDDNHQNATLTPVRLCIDYSYLTFDHICLWLNSALYVYVLWTKTCSNDMLLSFLINFMHSVGAVDEIQPIIGPASANRFDCNRGWIKLFFAFSFSLSRWQPCFELNDSLYCYSSVISPWMWVSYSQPTPSTALTIRQQGRNRLSNKFIPVTKDKPSNSADTSSHQILLKAGFVRQVQDALIDGKEGTLTRTTFVEWCWYLLFVAIGSENSGEDWTHYWCRDAGHWQWKAIASHVAQPWRLEKDRTLGRIQGRGN